jgi:hypothetical protein
MNVIDADTFVLCEETTRPSQWNLNFDLVEFFKALRKQSMVDVPSHMETLSYPISRYRLLGVNPPEKDTAEGYVATDSVIQFVDPCWFDGDRMRVVRSDMLGNFGRPLVTLWVKPAEEWVNLNEWVIENTACTECGS